MNDLLWEMNKSIFVELSMISWLNLTLWIFRAYKAGNWICHEWSLIVLFACSKAETGDSQLEG